ncbi:hypothetical protein DFH09DRAFT_1086652 [Mycena vulgaris]|nr:hypothetical protein DFH09DRAFT_1086652 [Mycena vulgaris]
MDLVHQTGALFLVPSAPFPEALKGIAVSEHPHRGVLEINENQVIPGSIAVQLAISHPRIIASDPAPVPGPSRKRGRKERLVEVVVPANLVASTLSAPSSRVSDRPDGDAAGTPFGLDFDLDSNLMQDPISSPPGSSTVGRSPPKLQRIVAPDRRERALRPCRRCHKDDCPYYEIKTLRTNWSMTKPEVTDKHSQTSPHDAIRVSYLSPPKFGISLVNWLTGAQAASVLHNGCAARGGTKGLKTREYPAAVSSRRTPNTSRTRGVHVAVRRAEVLYAPPWRQECCTRHRVVGTLSPRQNATRRSNSEVACSRLGHTERDWGPQGRQSVVVFDCMLGTSVASGEGTSRGEEAAGGGGG